MGSRFHGDSCYTWGLEVAGVGDYSSSTLAELVRALVDIYCGSLLMFKQPRYAWEGLPS